MDLSEPVKSLATIVRASLSTTRSEPVAVSERLASLAIHRHRVGPLVQVAVAEGRALASDTAVQMLQAHWLDNCRRGDSCALSLSRAGAALWRAEIDYLAFKGVTLSEQLYPNRQWRHSGDTDILVAPSSLASAAAALRRARFTTTDPVFFLPPPVRAFAMATVRDVIFDDPILNQRLELHARLIFSQTTSALLLAEDPSLRPRRASAAGVIPSPDIGPGFALYLIHHGALSGWTRLKWLADVLPLLAKLDNASRDRLAALAERSGTAAAVKASLWIAISAFGEFDLGPLRLWLAEAAGQQAVCRRVRIYAARINEESNDAPNPQNSRTQALLCTTLLHDSLQKQAGTLPQAALNTSLRLIAQAAKSLAGSSGSAVQDG